MADDKKKKEQKPIYHPPSGQTPPKPFDPYGVHERKEKRDHKKYSEG